MTLWLVVTLVAVLVALDKSFIPGAAILGMGFLAAIIPAREASGITLALIIIADWTAIWAYRKNVNWKALRRLLPNVFIGVLLGALFLLYADDAATGRTIGVILLVFITWNVATMLRRRHRATVSAQSTDSLTPEGSTSVDRAADGLVHDSDEGDATSGGSGSTGTPAPSEAGTAHRRPDPVVAGTATTDRNESDEQPGKRFHLRPKSLGYGALAGFTTMVANAGGPVTSMYFLSEGFPVMSFLGTSAWFYLIVNLVKLPFSLSLGMLTTDNLPMVATMIPVILLTVLFGRWCARRVNPSVFSTVVIALTFVAAIQLIRA